MVVVVVDGGGEVVLVVVVVDGGRVDVVLVVDSGGRVVVVVTAVGVVGGGTDVVDELGATVVVSPGSEDVVAIGGDVLVPAAPVVATRVARVDPTGPELVAVRTVPATLVGTALEAPARTTPSVVHAGMTIWVHVSAPPKDPSAQPLTRMLVPGT